MKLSFTKKLTLGIAAALLLLLLAAVLLLTSSYACCHWWLPLAGRRAGVELTARECSVSLLPRARVVLAGVELRRTGLLELQLDQLRAELELGRYLRTGELVFPELELDRPRLRWTGAEPAPSATAAESPAATPSEPAPPAAPAAPAAQSPGSDAGFRLPVQIGALNVTGGELTASTPDSELQLSALNFQLRDLAPGRTAAGELTVTAAARLRELRLIPTPGQLDFELTLPAEPTLYGAGLRLTLDTEAGTLYGAGLEPTAAMLQLELNTALAADRRFRLDAAGLRLRDEVGRPLLTAEAAGHWSPGTAGELRGHLEAGPAPLLDALAGQILKRPLQALAVTGEFTAALAAGGDFAADGTLQATGTGLPLEPLKVTLSARGKQRRSCLTLERGELQLVCGRQPHTAQLQLQQPLELDGSDSVLRLRRLRLKAKLELPDLPGLLRQGGLPQVPLRTGALAAELELAAPEWPGTATLTGALTLRDFRTAAPAPEATFQQLATDFTLEGAMQPGGGGLQLSAASARLQLDRLLDLAAQLESPLTLRDAPLRNLKLKLQLRQLAAGELLQRCGLTAFPLRAGTLTGELQLALPELPGAVEVAGTLTGTGLQLHAGAVTGPAFAATLRTRATYAAGSELTIPELTLAGTRNDAALFTLSGSGAWPLSQRPLQLTLEEVSEETLRLLPWLDGKLPGLQSLNGNLTLELRQSAPGTGSATGSLALRQLRTSGRPEPVEFDARWQLAASPEELTLSELTLQAPKLLELAATGRYRTAAKTPLELKLELKQLQLDELLALQQELTTATAVTPTASAAVPAAAATAPAPSAPPAPANATPAVSATAPELPPLDLTRLNGRIELTGRQIRYGRELEATVAGALLISGNRLSLPDWTFSLNGAPARLTADLDAGTADGYPFSLNTSITELPLAPLGRLLSGNAEEPVKGVLSQLSLDARGRGLTPRNLQARTQAELNFTARELAIPIASSRGSRLVRLVFLPIEAVLSGSEQLQAGQLLPELQELKRKLTAILDGREDFLLNAGSGRLKLAAGEMQLQELAFAGGTLDREEVTGRIGLLTQTLDLNTRVVFKGLILPLPIGGSFARPQPDFREFLKQFVGDNLKESLKPENLGETLRKVNTIIELFR